MTIIKPTYEIARCPLDPIGMYQHIEKCGRIAYKSEDKITSDSYKPFLTKLLNLKHLSVFEHGSIYIAIDSKWAIKKVQKAIHAVNNKFINIYFTHDKNDHRAYVYGNVRAWIEFIESCYHNNKALFVGHCIENVLALRFDLLFDSGSVRLYFHNFLERKLKVQYHYAPLAIAANTMFMTVDRAIQNELVRHRCASFTVESTRYVNYGNKELQAISVDKLYVDPTTIPNDVQYDIISVVNVLNEIEACYKDLISSKVAPQFARKLLPLCLATSMAMTAYRNNWFKIYKLRSAPGAHPEAQEVAKVLLDKLFTDKRACTIGSAGSFKITTN